MREVYCGNYERCMHEKASWKGVYKVSYLYSYIIYVQEREEFVSPKVQKWRKICGKNKW